MAMARCEDDDDVSLYTLYLATVAKKLYTLFAKKYVRYVLNKKKTKYILEIRIKVDVTDHEVTTIFIKRRTLAMRSTEKMSVSSVITSELYYV